MSSYKQFIFKTYNFDAISKTLSLHYSFDTAPDFTETYTFDFDFADYDPAALDRAAQTLFLMAGVSYYKAYPLSEIVIDDGSLDPEMATFFSKTYQRGLGEFFYVNNLDPRTLIHFPSNVSKLPVLPLSDQRSGMLVGIGGGKDSLVSVELLQGRVENLATWSVGHRPQLTPLVERIGLPHYWVDRQWDLKLLELNTQDALNGHVPISAIFACVGAMVAILSGRRDVIVSNEQSANEPTLHYKNMAINHQYSKSQEFEKDFQKLIKHLYGDQLRYYSFLRPLSEVHIAELFVHVGFEKYKDFFSSCNRAFTHDSNHIFWDGTCPKCAFVFLAFTPFVSREKLETLFSGKNLLLDAALEPTYRQLLGIEGDKPLECVGEIKESRAAMHLAEGKYSELENKYSYELPSSYDYRTIGTHEMPPEIYQLFTTSLAAV